MKDVTKYVSLDVSKGKIAVASDRGTVLLSPFSNAWLVRMNGKLKSRQKGSIAKIIWIPGHIIFGWVEGPVPLTLFFSVYFEIELTGFTHSKLG